MAAARAHGPEPADDPVHEHADPGGKLPVAGMEQRYRARCRCKAGEERGSAFRGRGLSRRARRRLDQRPDAPRQWWAWSDKRLSPPADRAGSSASPPSRPPAPRRSLTEEARDRVAEGRVGDQVRAVGPDRRVAAVQLVDALRAGLDPLQPVADGELDRLIVAGLEVQELELLQAAPLAAVEGVACRAG